MDIVDYTVVSKIGISGFNEEVRQHIKSGWAPLGGVSVNTTLEKNPNGETLQKTQYSQAMIKYVQK